LFLGTASVEKKIDNYHLFRGDLRLRFQINGNPFYYGQMVCANHPLATEDDFHINVTTASAKDVVKMALSQMTNVYLNPTDAQGGVLQCDYFYPANYIRLASTERANLGRVHLRSMAPLAHANASTRALDISVFAYMENSVLTVPTSQTFQSEYVKKPVSAVASTVAKAAGAFRNVPILGPYAKATEQVATGIGSAARALGYSRPPVMDPPIRVERRGVGQLAVTNMDEVVDKLALDVKQELSIDPRVTGSSPVDEMSFDFLLQKESFLCNTLWNVDDTPDTFLWNAKVSPTLATIATTPNTGITMMGTTPMSYIAPLFRYWTGNMIFRFVVVASKYHQGRLRVTLDPNRAGSSGGDWNTVYTQIVDISETKEFEINANWMAPTAFADVGPTFQQNWSSDLQYDTADDATTNGVIKIEVLNELTTPSTGGDDVRIMCFVRGGETLSFMNPVNVSDNLKTVYHQTFQSVRMDVAQQGAAREADHTLDVYGGEAVTSIRQLMRRYCFYRSVADFNTGPEITKVSSIVRSDFPASRGIVLNAIDESATVDCNYVGSNYLSYFQGCYLARRGAVRYKHVVTAASDKRDSSLWVERRLATIPLEKTTFTYTDGSLSSIDSNKTARNGALLTKVMSGGSMSVGGVNPTLEVELPFYSKYRFALTRKLDPLGVDFDDTSKMGHRVRVLMASDVPGGNGYFYTMQSFVASGEDFMFCKFLYTPPLFSYADLTTV
jgi:hypothetical protein